MEPIPPILPMLPLSNIESRLRISNVVLGAGGFARVVKAELDGQAVALKMLLPRWCNPEDSRCRAFQDQFIREGRFLSQQDHPNIIKCMGLALLPLSFPGHRSNGYKHPAWCLVLELCKDGTVARQVFKQMTEYTRIYSDAEALAWMWDIAQGLHYMHTLPTPVVHRDMKLDNVLLTKIKVPEEEGGGYRMVAKLADLGLHSIMDGSKRTQVRDDLSHHRSVGLKPTASADAYLLQWRDASYCTVPPDMSNAQSKMPAASGDLPSQSPHPSGAVPPEPESFATDPSGWDPRLLLLSHHPSRRPPSRHSSKSGASNAGGSSRGTSIAQFIRDTQVSSPCEPAYNMTGETGSAIYMSPEVLCNKPYNEKVDVYSFGIMFYEIFSRTVLVVTEGASDPDVFAAKMANGYRPARPIKMDTEIFQLIEWCWKADPNERPTMENVIDCLQLFKDGKAAAHAMSLQRPKFLPAAMSCSCAIS